MKGPAPPTPPRRPTRSGDTTSFTTSFMSNLITPVVSQLRLESTRSARAPLQRAYFGVRLVGFCRLAIIHSTTEDPWFCRCLAL